MNDKLDKARKEINEIDKEMAELFLRRMKAAKDVAEYKRDRGLAILDEAREKEVISKNSAFVKEDNLRDLYVSFLQGTMNLSKIYQGRLINGSEDGCKGKIHINLGSHGYDIHLGRGMLDRAGELFNLDRRVLIVTDTGVPREYAERLGAQCKEARIITVKCGEESKSFELYKILCHEMLDFGMTRTDCAVAVGGGVVGDLTGLAASSYMRGIDFYNIPTTLLSQLDSSIGGKTAINLDGVKNIVGAFYQPCGVIIDPDVLNTLPQRQIASGLAEAIKMSLTSDAELFELISNDDVKENIEEIIYRSLMIKKQVVEADEREGGIRRILNFGHTLGHGIEAAEEINTLYHGECVAIGMIPVSSTEVREKLVAILEKFGLPTKYNGDIEKALSFIKQDKKCDGNKISVVFVDEIGSYRIEKTDVESFCSLVREEYKI
ncbi:MAG: 3-dehydroquinate synthase [Clostridia bacterium]|nr:3-dehydroquinate synthase [Clostridia bacterium]